MTANTICTAIMLTFLLLLIFTIFGFGFYSFVRTCQQAATKRIVQCSIVGIVEQDYTCKGIACWVIYITYGYPKASSEEYQYKVFSNKDDADAAVLALRNMTTIECLIAPCFFATSDPNTCIFVLNYDFGSPVVLSLIFGVVVASLLSVGAAVLMIHFIKETVF